ALMAVLPHYRAALEKSLKRPLVVLGIGYSALAASCCLVPFLGSQFFPPAERNQLLVDIETPSSDSLTSLRTTVDKAAAIIRGHEEVLSAAVFTGGTAPRFYYNVEPKEPANYLAQILINTRHADDVTDCSSSCAANWTNRFRARVALSNSSNKVRRSRSPFKSASAARTSTSFTSWPTRRPPNCAPRAATMSLTTSACACRTFKSTLIRIARIHSG